MKLLNNHYFSTLSCYNTRLLDSLQAKFLRLSSHSQSFILPCSCRFSVCPKNRVFVFRFMKKTCIFLYFFLSQKRCKECALAHSGVSRGRLRHVSASRECASSRSVFMRLIQSSDFKPVSNAPYRLNILRFRRVELDLLTDLLNMHGNRRDVSQRLHIPDLAEEFFLGKYMVRVLC